MTEKTPTVRETSEQEELLIDSFMGQYDFSRLEHIVVEAPTDATYRAARELDLMSVGGPLVKALMWARELPHRLPGRLGRRPAPPRPERATLDDLDSGTDWVLLGERPGSEVVFGVVGTFWRPDIVWRRVEAADFASFAEPGWGKIAANFSVRPYGAGRTLLVYEARTRLTDPRSRTRFRWYWAAVSPFVGAVLRAALRSIKRDAEARPQVTITRV
ncbi:hypothetical protein AB0K60_15350 [Thermopolyspora sp. NPDC052614]|uniref:hypothetical protein n=1 Tax=Thermopolyspora sp. NPDC052614 TaxID=3155682 RepID=UPI0034345F5C